MWIAATPAARRDGWVAGRRSKVLRASEPPGIPFPRGRGHRAHGGRHARLGRELGRRHALRRRHRGAPVARRQGEVGRHVDLCHRARAHRRPGLQGQRRRSVRLLPEPAPVRHHPGQRWVRLERLRVTDGPRRRRDHGRAAGSLQHQDHHARRGERHRSTASLMASFDAECTKRKSPDDNTRRAAGVPSDIARA